MSGNLQTRYEKLMNFNTSKQLDELKNNLKRLEKEQLIQAMKKGKPKKVMFTEDIDFAQKWLKINFKAYQLQKLFFSQ